jgi:hypothetical protein
MKKLIVLFLLVTNTLFSQDTIFFVSGEILLSKVLEVNTIDIKYKKYIYLDGPIYTRLKTDVKEIVYPNGTKDTFALAENTIDSFVYEVDMPLKGREDAKKYYEAFVKPSKGVFFSSAFVPPVGLVAAIACSLSKPLDQNLNYPDANLMKNQQYSSAYRREAFRIKRKRVWGNFVGGIFLSVYVVAIVRGVTR